MRPARAVPSRRGLALLRRPSLAENLESLQRRAGNQAAGRFLTEPTEFTAAPDQPSEEGEGYAPSHSFASGAEPLPSGIRAFFERFFQRSLAQIRIHRGRDGAAAARSLSATSFTTGSDIFFADSSALSQSGEGRALLGHELTHAIQADLSVPPSRSLSSSADPAEKEAGQAAALALSPFPVTMQVDRRASAWIHRADDEPTTGSDLPVPLIPAPPAMYADLEGLHFVPVAGTMLSRGRGRPQIIAAVLSALVGSHSTPELVKSIDDEMQKRGDAHLAHQWGQMATNIEKPERMGHTLFETTEALWLVDLLKDRKLPVGLTDEQRTTLQLSAVTESLWYDLMTYTTRFPAWYTLALLRTELMSYRGRLEAYRVAQDKYVKEPTDANRQELQRSVVAIFSALLPAAAVLELIRDDAALAEHPAYRLIWPPGRQAVLAGSPTPAAAKAAPKERSGAGAVVRAPPMQPPRTDMAANFLSYAHTVPDVLKAAGDPANSDARRKLLDFFGRFVAQARPVTPEQVRMMSEPSRYNRDPVAARLSSTPPLTPPAYVATWTTDYSFAMEMDFQNLEFWLPWAYNFERIKVPEGQIKKVADESRLKGETSTFKEVAGLRYGRTGFYAYEDITRMTSRLESDFGAPGSSVGLTAFSGLLSYVGTTVRLAFMVAGTRSNEVNVVFPQDGFYLIRATATQLLTGEEAVAHAPSVAYTPAFVRDPAEISQSALAEVIRSRADALAKIAEIKGQLDQPGLKPEAEAGLRKELERLTKLAESVPSSLEQQIADLKAREEGLPADSRQREQVKTERERLEEIKDTRDKRAKKRTGEQLSAVFTSDEGQTLPLLLEAFFIPLPESRPPMFQYNVSDLTTPKSDDATQTAGTRADAIMDAITVILEGIHGYGRGQVSVEIDQVTHRRRIAASKGSILVEALGNLAQVLSIAAVVAAPFTGGESLALMIPAGLIGAVPSAYRVLSRVENRTFHFDQEMAMDVVNIVGSLVGAAEAVTPLRMVRLSTTLMVIGVGANGTGVLLMGYDLIRQIDAINADQTLTPGARQARLMQVLGGAMLNAGIMIGGLLAAKGRVQERSTAGEAADVGERATPKDASFQEWEQHVSPETLEALATDRTLTEEYSRMDPEVRKALTVCESVCIPIHPRPTARQVQRIKDVLKKLGLSGDDQRLREYFHWNKENLSAAITALEKVTNGKQLTAVLDKSIASGSTVGPAVKRGGVWEVRRADGQVVTEYQTGRHGDIKTTATEGFFQSHHGIQDAWAQERRIPGYSREDAPGLLLRDSYAGTPHQIVTARQTARAEGRVMRTYAQERTLFIADMEAAGGPKDVSRQVLRQNDAYFGRLYTEWRADLIAKGASYAQANATLAKVFGGWKP